MISDRMLAWYALIVSIVGVVISILGVGISVCAVLDVRDQVKRLIKLERKRVFIRVRSDMVWQFVNATPQSHTSEIAKGLEEFSVLSKELDRSQTSEHTTDAVNKESLRYADNLVKGNYATWKPDWNMKKVQEELDKWQAANNKNLLTSIDPELTKNTLL